MYYINQIGFIMIVTWVDTCHVTYNGTTSCPCIFQEILVTWHTMSLLPVRVCSRKSPWSRDYGFYRCFTPSHWPSTCFLYSTRVHNVRFQLSNSDEFIIKNILVLFSYMQIEFVEVNVKSSLIVYTLLFT